MMFGQPTAIGTTKDLRRRKWRGDRPMPHETNRPATTYLKVASHLALHAGHPANHEADLLGRPSIAVVVGHGGAAVRRGMVVAGAVWSLCENWVTSNG
jgi:hypothetical protein